MGSLIPVYVIDDDEGMLESTQFLLQALGIQSNVYSDPLAFLRAVGTLDPGCILTDLHMPSISGIELRAALTARGIDWPFILMSGNADVEDRRPGAGILDLIEKPFTRGRLLAVLERAFAALGHV